MPTDLRIGKWHENNRVSLGIYYSIKIFVISFEINVNFIRPPELMEPSYDRCVGSVFFVNFRTNLLYVNNNRLLT
jgi:hypothetical protein